MLEFNSQRRTRSVASEDPGGKGVSRNLLEGILDRTKTGGCIWNSAVIMIGGRRGFSYDTNSNPLIINFRNGVCEFARVTMEL